MELKLIKAGDEVIVPASTFATVSAPIYQLGLVPVYVDNSERTWCIDANKIELAISPRTKVVMLVHNLGFPADMNKITKICRSKNIILFEDCCEAHGATYDGNTSRIFRGY